MLIKRDTEIKQHPLEKSDTGDQPDDTGAKGTAFMAEYDLQVDDVSTGVHLVVMSQKKRHQTVYTVNDAPYNNIIAAMKAAGHEVEV